MTDEELAEIKARADAATPGPWIRQPFDSVVAPASRLWIVHGNGTGVVSDEDAHFIAHARDDIPALLVEVERSREIVRAIVNDPPEYEDNAGSGCCCFCGELTRYNEHQPDCLLLKARALLAGGEEETRP